jgi:hypothetical protein
MPFSSPHLAHKKPSALAVTTRNPSRISLAAEPQHGPTGWTKRLHNRLQQVKPPKETLRRKKLPTNEMAL